MLRSSRRVGVLRRHLTTGAAPAPAAAAVPAAVSRLAAAAAAAAPVTHRVVAVERPGTGIETTDHEFDVPLDWARGGGERLTVFAREVTSLAMLPKKEQLPVLVFLQGGPGGASPRPTGSTGWLKRALKDFRVLLLDQRGTGLSTPVTTETLVSRFGGDGAAIAEYLVHFRADAIVADAEAIRISLLGPGARWSTLAQSYGGWITLHYLSAAPGSLSACFVCGGIASPASTADDVYSATFQTVLRRNQQFYRKFPADIGRVRQIVRALAACDGGGAALPGGGLLTPRRFLSLGLGMGMTGGMDSLHWLLEGAFRHDYDMGSGAPDGLSYSFLRACEAAQTFETGPIFAILHESIYQGLPGQQPSAWAAQRVLSSPPWCDCGDFDWQSRLEKEGAPVHFTGEHIFPWFFDGDFSELAALKGAADILAHKADWPALYSMEALTNIGTPLAAVIYYDDYYVDRRLSEGTMKMLGPQAQAWVTNEHQHSGLRDDGEAILDRLIRMANGQLELPP
jgi:pimeloyl-ACP methyl ester carboxylesterase